MIVGRSFLKSSLALQKKPSKIYKPSLSHHQLKPVLIPSASRISSTYCKETDPSDGSFLDDDPYKHILNADEELDEGVNVFDNFSDFDPEGENPFKEEMQHYHKYKPHYETTEDFYKRKLLEDDERREKVHKNLDGHIASRIRPIHKDDVYKWSDLRKRVLRNAPKPGNVPRIKHVTFVPERQSDEIVKQKPIEIEDDINLLQYDEEEEDLWIMPDTPNRYLPKATPHGYSFGYGSRKSANAAVTLRKGTGNITVNGKHWIYYFKDYPVRNKVIEPLTVTETLNKWDITCRVRGGGFTGQSGALSLAIAKAIMRFDEGYIAPLRLAGLLSNDPRRVERKKTGRHKARRGFQWVKR